MSKKSKLTLIVDGNWLLMSRLSVLTNQFNSDEEICKELQLLMLKSINRVLNTFTDIDNIIFVSDGGSWRNQLEIPKFLYDEKTSEDQSVEYKGQRHLDENVNWDLVFNYYEDFLKILEENGITTCRVQNIEGDDWCWYWSTKLNEEGTNTMIWSMDKDLTQLVKTNDDNGIFTICWNNRTGLTCEKKEDEKEEDPLQFFFNDLNKEYNMQIFENITNKCKQITQINPKEIVIDKIIRGDKGDNIFPIILKKANNSKSSKKFRVGVKDINFELNLNNDDEIKTYIHNIINSNKYINKVDKSEQNIFEHFKYNYQLVSLSEDNYPQEILDEMNSYLGYHVKGNISDILSYMTAKNSNLNDILDNI